MRECRLRPSDSNHLAPGGIEEDVEAVASASVSPRQPAVDRSMSGETPLDGLTGRAAAGDVSAFERLYRAHVGRVYALCLRMAGDPHVAEELAQEAFIRAWQKLESFRGASAFSTWLHRLTVNVVLGHLRKAGRLQVLDDERAADLVADQPETSAHPGRAIDLERAIAELPAGARTVFVLHDVEGFRHHEIARLMGIAEGTSKAQLHRARKLLRKALKP